MAVLLPHQIPRFQVWGSNSSQGHFLWWDSNGSSYQSIDKVIQKIFSVDWPLQKVERRKRSEKLPWLGFEPQTWKHGIWNKTGTATVCWHARHAVKPRCRRKEGKRPMTAYCLTQCSNGWSLGSLFFPRQDHHVQRGRWTCELKVCVFLEPDNRKLGFAVVKESFVLPCVQLLNEKEQRERLICCCAVAISTSHRTHDVNAAVGTETKTTLKSIFLQVQQQLPQQLATMLNDAPWNLDSRYEAYSRYNDKISSFFSDCTTSLRYFLARCSGDMLLVSFLIMIRVVFDDSIRAMAASTRIRKNQERIRELKLNAINTLLDLPIGTSDQCSDTGDSAIPNEVNIQRIFFVKNKMTFSISRICEIMGKLRSSGSIDWSSIV